MNFYSEGLTSTQYKVLCQLASQAETGSFYLGGGTALSAYLRHRQSVDLDWFTSEHFSDPIMFSQALRDSGLAFSTGQTAPGTLHGQVEGVRVSFFEFRYPLLSPLVRWQESGVNLASLDDLACMKLAAVAQRGSKKDFFDVHALCLKHRPIEQMLDLYQRKFSVTDIVPVLFGLVYFDDADEERDPILFEQMPWSQVKLDLRSWVKRIE